jgi:hypothetical protein
MIVNELKYKKMKKDVKNTGSVSSILGQHWNGMLTNKANGELELTIKDMLLGDVIYLNEDAIDDLEVILTFKKEIRDREEAR